MLDALAAVAQALLYLGVALASGGVLADATLRPNAALRGTLQRLVQRGSLILIVALLFGLSVLMLRLGAFDASIATAVLTSNVGGAAGLRLAGAVLLLVLPDTDDDGFSRGMRLTSALIIAAAFLYSGHAATESLALGALTAVHVLIVGWWISSLVLLRTACASMGVDAAALVQRFSAIAVWGVALLAFAGVLLILGLVDVAAFAVTPYVRNLLVKLGIVVAVFAIAAYNKFVLTPGVLARQSVAILKLRRVIELELALLAAVLIATSIMTTYTSPHE